MHEAWIKLGDGRFENCAHFVAAAAEALWRILVDKARRKHSVKQSGAMQRADWSSLDLAAEAPVCRMGSSAHTPNDGAVPTPAPLSLAIPRVRDWLRSARFVQN